MLSITIVACYVLSTSHTTPTNYHTNHQRRQLRATQTTNQTYSNRSLQIQLEKTRYKIPIQLEHNLIDWEDIPQTSSAKATPIFWHILKSGGTTVKLMYAQCYGLIEACETGVLENVWYDSSTGNNNVPNPMEWIQQQQQQQFNGNDNQRRRRLEHMDSAGDENVYGTAGGASYAPEGDSTFVQQQQPNNVDEESQLYAPVQQSEEIIPAEEDIVREVQEYNSPGDTPPQIEGHLEGSVLSAPEPQQQKQQESDLKIVVSGDGRKYVNVDVTTTEGIIQASQRGFATSNLADIIFTPLLLEASELLLNGDTNKGRMFALFRHPIERLTSIFYYLQKATWEPTYDPQLAQMTIDDYARSGKCESNWLVRSLVGQMEGPLNSDSLEIAKEVLRQKCLVGFMDEMEESIERFHSYFGFGDDAALECAKQSFTRKGSSQSNKNKHPPLDGESETYAILAKKNELDILLYFFAKKLFDEQKKLIT